MEGKKLNLNQPFLSVRRHSQGVTASAQDDERRRHPPLIPYYKPEIKSGPVGKKGAVPFHWEQTPGEPREEITTMVENKSQTAVNLQSATKLPPGRYHKPIVQNPRSPQVCQKNFENNGKSGSNDGSFESVKENNEEKRSSSNTEDDGNNIYEDDDDNEAYTDALDTLSRTNSTFLNCSLSGVSGLEDLDIKPCRNFSRDQSTLDLVMDRFLPAAKAMVSETPQYAPKKPIANHEESREVNKIAIKKGDDKPLLLRYGSSFANRYLDYYHASEEDEEESSDDDRDGHGTLIPSVCGLLPRFCLKGSSGILNPVPGLSTKTRAAKSHVNQVRNRSSSNWNNTMTRNDFKSERCDTKPVDHTGTIEIKETEAALGSKSCERVFTTFGEFLDDKDGPEQELDSVGVDVPEDVLRIKSIQAIESEAVPNEVVGSSDEDRAMKADQEHVVPSDGEDRAMKADQEHVVPSDEEDRAMKADQEHVVDCHSDDLKNLHLVESNENATATDDTETDLKKSGICNKKYSEIIISPPLPKSPSDSWLWRTLPSVSANNAHRHLNFVSQKLNPKVPIGVTRWEAIVKFSKLQHDDSHYPE